jgi:hypothetical protein
MLRLYRAALAAATLLALASTAVQAQLVPRDPKTPGIVLPPDLVAVVEQGTRIVFAKRSMRVDGAGSTALRPIVDMAQCSGLQEGQRRVVAVPPLKWGVHSNHLNQTTSLAGEFVVTLSYQTFNNGVVADQLVSETVSSLGTSAERLFDFTHPLRAGSYEVTLFREPARTPRAQSGSGGSGPSVTSGAITPPDVLRTFCVPSTDAIDHAMLVTVDPGGQVDDANRANNVLRLP